MVNRKPIDPTKSAAHLYAFKLRRLRDEKGWSQPRLGQEVNCTGDLISKIETGAAVATPQMSRAFDAIFGTAPWFEEHQPLAAQDGLPGWFQPYAAYEAKATSLRLFNPLHIPGLCQTEAHARHVLGPGQHPNQLDQSVMARLARQAILHQERPPWVFIVVTEQAVRKTIGDSDVMREQYEQLLALMREVTITIRILLESAAIYPGGGFTIFSSEDEYDIAWIEAVGAHGRPIEENAQVEELKVLWDMIGCLALTPEASEQFIRDLLEAL